MNAKDILNKVKAIFDAPIVPVVAEEPVAPASPIVYQLQDGSEIEVAQAGDVVAPGDTVTIQGAAAADGDYVIMDGSVLVVAGGVVAEVKPVEPVTASVENEPVVPVEPAGPTAEERIASLEDALKKLSVRTSLEEEVKLKLEKQDEVIKGLFELAEKLSETPTADPITLTGNKKDQFERTNAREKKLEGIAAAIKEMKNK